MQAAGYMQTIVNLGLVLQTTHITLFDGGQNDWLTVQNLYMDRVNKIYDFVDELYQSSIKDSWLLSQKNV